MTTTSTYDIIQTVAVGQEPNAAVCLANLAIDRAHSNLRDNVLTAGDQFVTRAGQVKSLRLAVARFTALADLYEAADRTYTT